MKTLPTLNVDNFYTIVQLSNGSLINIHIYDTLGQERFNSINESYYKKGEAVLLVYDISSKSSFERIKNYYVNKIKASCEKDIPILLLANKTDLEDKREVSKEEGMALAIQENYEFQESSCQKNLNVAGAFVSLIERWNFENQKKMNNTPNKSSKIVKSNILQKTMTEMNLENEMKKCNTERKRSQSTFIENKRGKRESIKLTKGKAKKSNHKKRCC